MTAIRANLIAISVVPLMATQGLARSLTEEISSAQAVVSAVGTAEPVGDNELRITLVIGKVWKGQLPSGIIESRLVRTPDPRLPALMGSTVCGLFLLNNTRGAWTVAPQEEPVMSLADAYFPSDSCSSGPVQASGANAQVEAIIAEYLRALEHVAPEPPYILRMFSEIRPRESAAVDAASKRFMKSDRPGIRALGVMWRIAENDAAAMLQAGSESSLFSRSPFNGMLAVSIASYSSPDTAGVQALGAFASSPDEYVQQAASEALRDIHTRDALPYLSRLLSSAVPRVRQNALAGLSFYLLRAPVLNDANRAREFERATNLATRTRLTRDEQAHIHFGPVQDRDMAELIGWWRLWVEAESTATR